MGFLDSLKEIGIGNTGPRGITPSGATNLTNYVQQRQGFESERGVTQALALAAKNNPDKELSMLDFIDISEKWGVPLSEVIQRGKVINDTKFAQSSKKKLHTAMQIYANDKKHDPGLVPDEKYMINLIQKVGLYDPRETEMLQAALTRLQDQKKYMEHDPQKALLSISGNKIKEERAAVPGQEPPPKTAMAAYLRKNPNATAEQIAAFKRSLSQDKKEKVSMWVLPNRETVRSYDEGQTYVKGDRTVRMPDDANKITTQMSGADIETLRGQKRLQEELQENPPQPATGPSAKQTAQEGTGPWAMVAAGVDAVAGGLGLDKLVGKDGFFPTITDARQDLRLIKQMGKSALMNSSRGAIWEQQKIDRLFPDPDSFFTNPRTEARKFRTLTDALNTEKHFNNVAISKATNPKEIERLKSSNTDIDRLLAHIQKGASVETELPPLSPEAQQWLNKKGY